MPDADLIYDAHLRAEAKIERLCLEALEHGRASEMPYLMAAFCAVKTLREEIGAGLAKERI
jgi:hypothetical protein